MTNNAYFRNYVILITILTVILVAIYMHGSPLANHIDMGVITILGYSLLSFLHFFFAQLLQSKKDKMVLFFISLSHMFLKLVLTGILLAVYYKVTSPPSNYFALVFIIVYIGFGIFEGIYATQQVKN